MRETIPCEVCLDLLPLVQDGVASDASKQLVAAHLADCPACRNAMGNRLPEEPDDRRVLAKLRRWVSLRLLGFLVLGILAGALLTYYGGYGAVFLLLLLPGIGAVNQLFWRERWWLAPASVTAAFTLFGIANLVIQRQFGLRFWAWVPLFAAALGLLCLLGNAAAALFRFALTKEPTEQKEDASDEET